MANELILSSQISYVKGIISLSASIQEAVTIAGEKYVDLIQDIPTSNTLVDWGDVGSPGIVMIQNLGLFEVRLTWDLTNYIVTLPAATATAPGGIFIAYANIADGGDLIYAKAITTASVISVRAFEP